MALFLQADVLKATLATDAVIGSTVRAVIFTVKNCTTVLLTKKRHQSGKL